MLLVATAGSAEPAALTWQEANQRSAALIREKGPGLEAADLARQAFDLYREQSRSYDATNHAQLLLNAVDARRKAAGDEPALEELDRGAAAIAAAGGQDADVLIVVWEEGATIAGRGTRRAVKYIGLAYQQAEKLFGPDHPRTIGLLLDVINDNRREKSKAWAALKYGEARERALKAGPDSSLVTRVDLQLAKLALEEGQPRTAIQRYRALIERLEQRAERDQETHLQAAYAQLEFAYEETGDEKAAAEVRARRIERLTGSPRALEPTLRVAPQYPWRAARDGTEGFVDMEIRVNPDGTVADARIIRSQPTGIFDEAALAVIRKWKFKPEIVDGTAVESMGRQLIQFRLERRSH